MNDEALDGAASANKLESSLSRASGKARLIAAAEEEGLFSSNRSGWAARWQHPLAKSIEARRGKISRLWTPHYLWRYFWPSRWQHPPLPAKLGDEKHPDVE